MVALRRSTLRPDGKQFTVVPAPESRKTLTAFWRVLRLGGDASSGAKAKSQAAPHTDRLPTHSMASDQA